ncbi:MAG: organic solvent tolerance protein [Sphingomonas bacterium]|nr:LPS assembly protein LptD [Sphingomonas bacterium]MDB5690072.1 organic solvent tolerance protein [Sphingomonas bacterium]
MTTSRPILLAALPVALLACAPVWAQDLQTPSQPAPSANGVPMPANDEEVAFSSATLDYDGEADVVTATGDVRMVRAGNRLRADKVTWDRKSGRVMAAGGVSIVNPGGDTVYADSAELTDTLKDGVVENLLLVLEDGGRLAALHGSRVAGITTLNKAAYTPCAVTDNAGCAKEPLWKITAVRVVHNPDRRRIFYKDAQLSILGATVLWLPAFSHPDGSGGGGPGLLVPDFRYSRTNGLEVALPYYLRIGPNRDLTITPHVYSDVLPAIEGEYRALTALGAYRLRGMVTYGSRLPASVGQTTPNGDQDRGIRGYVDANGRFQLDPAWSVSGTLRATTDKTFLRRYDISRDDRLRSSLIVERADEDSYLSIAGWAVQSLRAADVAGQQPIALPAIDYRRRIDDPLLGGKVELQLNSLSVLRTAGQDTQRAFAGARWDLRGITGLGQELTLTAYGRADMYHSDEIGETATLSYRGFGGWKGRGIGALAADMRWPFIGEAFGGTQRITPRVQLVATPPTRNLALPNEDARAVDLEDSNLFALNRFPGYDRWEDSSRMTYGLEYAFDRPRLSVRSIIGQSYRINNRVTILPNGTGLSDRMSDVVGRTTVRYASFVELVHRYRLDKDSFAIRRNEIDATLGSRRTYATIGYLRLNRNVNAAIEDLRDREEIRLGGRVQIASRWSLFGSTVVDLTGEGEDPLSIADGYEPVRHRVGVLYDDECIQLGVTWRRDYAASGDARRGNTFLLRLALKNLGR